jgi:hypothetical protein
VPDAVRHVDQLLAPSRGEVEHPSHGAMVLGRLPGGQARRGTAARVRRGMPSAHRSWSVAAAALLAAVLIAPSTASAWPVGSSFRCGSRLIGPGQTVDDVYALCGDPTDRAVSTELVTFRVAPDVAVTRPVVVDVWTYDRGPQQFVRFLTFRNGVLVDVDEGSYGR